MADELQSPKPIVKWVGGKTQLLSELHLRMPDFSGSYHEPFLGGGALFFSLGRQQSFVSDFNPKLVELYETVRDTPEELDVSNIEIETRFNALDAEEQKSFYYGSREEFNSDVDSKVRRASLFLFLNKAGFNGLYRENSDGKFNVPFGNRRSVRLGSLENFISISELLKNSNLRHGSYVSVLDFAREGDFVYLDPPYVPLEGTPSFTSYLSSGFGPQQQKELAEVFDELTRRGTYAMLSNSYTSTVRELYSKHNVNVVQARRNIAASGTKRGAIDEALVTNY